MKPPFSKIKSLFTKARDFLAPREAVPPTPKVQIDSPKDERPEWLKAALARLNHWIEPGIDYEARAEAKRLRRRVRNLRWAHRGF